jgi:hypothetical protein
MMVFTEPSQGLQCWKQSLWLTCDHRAHENKPALVISLSGGKLISGSLATVAQTIMAVSVRAFVK